MQGSVETRRCGLPRKGNFIRRFEEHTWACITDRLILTPLVFVFLTEFEVQDWSVRSLYLRARLIGDSEQIGGIGFEVVRQLLMSPINTNESVGNKHSPTGQTC